MLVFLSSAWGSLSSEIEGFMVLFPTGDGRGQVSGDGPGHNSPGHAGGDCLGHGGEAGGG